MAPTSEQVRPVLVLGSGLSGSLVVQALARHTPTPPVVVVDQHPRPCSGRSWAGFIDGGTRPLPGRVFRQVLIRGRTGQHLLTLEDGVYAVIDGHAMDQATDRAVTSTGGRRVVACVGSVHSAGDVATATTDAGRLVGDYAVDSTAHGDDDAASSSSVSMHFLGRQVVAPPGTFDPETVTLMDFTVAQQGQVRFGYVLPENPSRALVELVAITADPSVDLQADLCAYVDRLVGGSWVEEGRESGRILLDPRRRRRRHRRVLDIGVRGGVLRASTGYGVPTMVRDADRIADRLARGRSPRGVRRKTRYAFMDAVMLRLITSDPGSAARALEQMLARNPGDRVARFLGERSSVLDDARIAATLPVGPMLRAALAGKARLGAL